MQGIAWHFCGREKSVNVIVGWKKGEMEQDEAREAGRGQKRNCLKALLKIVCHDLKSNVKP